MSDSPPPPQLDYRSEPPAKSRPQKSERTVGLLGFLAYCLPAFLFDWTTIRLLTRMYLYHWSPSRLDILAISAALGIFCTWRAIAAIMQFFR